MNIIESLQWRYATKRFDSEKIIPQDKIELIKEAFNLTATSYGLQPIKLLIVKNKVLREQLLAHTYNQPQIMQASHLLVFCIETTIDKDFIEAYFNRVKDIRNTAESILKPYRDFLVNDFQSRSGDYVKTWAAKQAYLAMGNLLTVCAIEGIDSLPMEGFKPESYDDVLGLKQKGLQSVLIMPIGYRAEDDMFSGFKKVRKTVAESTLEL
ncbi:MAG: NAD(P)H-dependent oxidoreductase [Flavobacteriaceae bacterium]